MEQAVPHAPEHWGIVAELPRYLYASHYAKGMRVLDDGTGTGEGAALLAQTGAVLVLGIDVSEDTLNCATRQNQLGNLHYLNMDACSLGFADRQFDLVTSFSAIEYAADPVRYLSEVSRVLKPEGLLMLSTPNREAWSPDFLGHVFARAQSHLTEFSLAHLHDLIKPYFRYISWLGQSAVPSQAVGIAPSIANEVLACQCIGRLVISASHIIGQPPRVTEVGWFDGDNSPYFSAYHFAICSNRPLSGREYRSSGIPSLKALSDASLYAYNLYSWKPKHSAGTAPEFDGQHAQENQELRILRERLSEMQVDRARVLGDLRQRDEELLEKNHHLQILQEQLSEMEADRARALEELRRRDDQLGEKIRYIELLRLEQEHALEQLRGKVKYVERLQNDFAEKTAEVESLRREFDKVYSHLQALRQTRTVRLSRVAGMIASGLASPFKTPLQSAVVLFKARRDRLLHALKGPVQGAFDVPQRGSTVSGPLHVAGWAYSTASQIKIVEVLHEETGASLGSVRYGVARPDVVKARTWQEELHCGFAGTIDLSSLALGPATLVIRITDGAGNKLDLRRPVRVGQLVENTDSARQATTDSASSAVETPLAKVERTFWGGNRLEVEGWALWLTSSYPRVARIYLNDELAGETPVNLSRPDLYQQFPNHPNSARCGYRFRHLVVPSIGSVEKERKATLTVEFVEGQGKRFKRSIEIAREADVIQVGDPEAWTRFAEVIADYQSKFDVDPSILDWNTGLELASLFSGHTVFSPPVADSVLPYIDQSVGIVVVSSRDPTLIAEAHRVAVGAVAIFNPSEFTGDDQQTVPDASGPGIGLRVGWKAERRSVELPGASIIIPVHNQVNYTDSCLRALRDTLPRDFKGEIIIVDDASTDDTASVLERWVELDQRLIVLKNTHNVGFLDACNKGAEAATGDVLVFLNNDTLPQPNWLPPLLRTLRDYQDVGAVGGKLIFPDGRLQEAGGVIFSDGSGANFGKNDEEANSPLYSHVREVDYCSGALLATWRSLFREIGGFDTIYRPAYYEDADYCFSVREKGYLVYYQPESVVVHYEGGTSGTDLTIGAKQYQTVNRTKFVQKWRHVLRRQPLPPDRFEFATWHALAVRDVREGTEFR